MTQSEVQAIVEEALISHWSLRIENMGTVRLINPANYSIVLRMDEIQLVPISGGITITFRFDKDFTIQTIK